MRYPLARRLVWIAVGLAAAGCASDAGGVTGASAGAGPSAQPSAAGTSVGMSNIAAGTSAAAGSKAGAGSTASAASSGGSAGTKPVGAAGMVGVPVPPDSAGMAAAGRAGNQATGGKPGSAGQTAAGGAATAAGSGGTSGPVATEKFSFFMTSWKGLQRLSKSDKGFGGDLRYGQATGLEGADKICTDLAEASMPGAGAKGWRAFLSASKGPGGSQVDAIGRVGEGPWYDRTGRLLAMNKSALLATRPMGADPAIMNDLPNEEGVPNHQPDPGQDPVNNHHALTGSDAQGKWYKGTSTCSDWSSTASNAGRPRVGFSYPAGGRQHWISGQDEGGCGAGAVLVDMGGSDPGNPIVGSGGGYGGFYCFALKP